jgi:hypothetical protein
MFALADPSQREWRFLRQCRFTLETQHGSLSGQRQLTDDGERLNDDRYDWHFKQPFAGGLFLHLSWDGISSGTPWEGGGVDAYLHDDVELPSGRLTIRRSHGSKAWASLKIAMPQNENRIITGHFRLVDLLAFAKDDNMLEWIYEGQPKPRIVKTGKIDVAILREAVRAREAVEHKLTSLEPNYGTMCQRVPDYSPRIVI